MTRANRIALFLMGGVGGRGAVGDWLTVHHPSGAGQARGVGFGAKPLEMGVGMKRFKSCGRESCTCGRNSMATRS